MSRRKRKGLPQRLLYYSLLLFIFLMSYRVYRSWYEDYKHSHPHIIEAVTTNYSEEQPLDGILLWDEQLVYATKDGILTYPSPRPRMVANTRLTPHTFIPALTVRKGIGLTRSYGRISHPSRNFRTLNLLRTVHICGAESQSGN